jgi:predicted RNase H-like HicB family nuclease
MLAPDTLSRPEAQVQYHFSAIVGHDADGYWAKCPELQGCYSQGRTYEEALANLREAVGVHVEDRLALGEDIPQVEAISLITVEVAQCAPVSPA